MNGPYDEEFVATGTQLYVTVESEYRSKDKIDPDVHKMEPSYLVMPRILYLAQGFPGKLKDYVTVVPRAGAKAVKVDDSDIACSGKANGLQSGKIENKLAEMSPNVYSCSFKENNLESKFYVRSRLGRPLAKTFLECSDRRRTTSRLA